MGIVQSQDRQQPAEVLVVDDQPENLLAFKAALEGPRLTVLTARSGADALRALLLTDPAAILLDVAMPTMDGFEAALLIRGRERSRHIPIVMITASERGQEQLLRGLGAGAADYLEKPISPEVLRAKVQAMVELFESGQSHRAQIERSLEAERDRLRAEHALLKDDVAEHDALLREVASALRMPLTALKLHVQQALLYPDPAALRHHLFVADLQTTRLRDLVEETAEIWAARASGRALHGATTDLEQEVASALEDFSGQAAQQLLLEVRSGSRGAWPRPVLRALVRNLIRHALHVAPGSALTFGLDTASNRARLVVRDRCSKEELLHLPHTEALHASGQGIYAALARHAAKVLGGRLTLGDQARPEIVAIAELPLRVGAVVYPEGAPSGAPG